MLSLLVIGCSMQTSVVAPLTENGLQPPSEVGSTPAPRLHFPGVPEACDWPAEDPGDLVSTGAEPGDVADEILLWDQCGEAFSTWDLYGRYVLLYLTTFGCDGCDAGAVAIADDAAALAERVGVDVLPVVVVRETDGIATARTAGAALSARLDLHGFPVAADAEDDAAQALPWDGATFPTRCALAPDMTIVGCAADTDGTAAIEEWIREDAADR